MHLLYSSTNELAIFATVDDSRIDLNALGEDGEVYVVIMPDIPSMVLADNLGKNSPCPLRLLFDVNVPQIVSVDLLQSFRVSQAAYIDQGYSHLP